MAEGGSATFDLWLLLAALFVMFSLSVANIDLRGDRFVHTFEVSDFVEKNEIMVADDTDDVDDSWELRLPNIERHRRDADHKTPKTDKCYAQEQKNLGALAEGKAIHSTFSFKDDKNHGLALTWCGEGDSGNMLVVTTEQIQTLLSVHVKPSVVYRTTDGGVTFRNISNLVENAYIKKGNGLQRNPHNAKLVYLVAHSRDDVNKIYLTNDGGLNFEARAVPFRTDESFHFHPEVTFQVHMLVRSSARSLFMTVDNGKTWKKIADDVHDFKWGSTASEKGSRDYDGKVVYVLQYSTDNEENWWSSILGSNKVFQLKKSSDGGNTWKVLIEKALSFGLEGNFLYASVKGKKTGERIMKVSSNGGETWDETELPTILGDQFYSILDSSEGMIFMHVDNPGDTGHGTLYTSAGKGIIFSESLRKHLYPNFAQQTDFYKVESMRGVYVASQMLEDDSIHSRISYDRGGVWQSLPRPPNAPCKDLSKECSLQLHNTYSISRGITAKAPLSVAKAKGIVLAHGHVASSLQTTSPDVFITSDGGYTWKKTLDGPHHYQIADSGGMILAVPIASDKTATYVKFSLDQGDCWHTYNFTEDPIIFTGLLTEPGSKSLTIGLWGFTKNDSVWRVHTIDFNKLVPKRCEGEDYEEFVAHATLRKGENKDVEGCLLGVREKFHRIKPYSWCKNGYYPQPQETREVCKCTREDYECDYSYFRPVGSDKCEKEPQFKIKEVDICKRGHLEEIITQGYRKIPGDKCEKGEVYLDGKVLNLTQHCSNNQAVVKEEVKEEYIEKIEHEDNVVLEHKTPTKSSRKRFLIITAVSVVVLGLIGTMTLFFVCRYYALRRHQVTYRYSLLNQTEEQDFDGDLENVLTSQSGVYGDSDDEEPRMSHTAVPNGRTNKRTTSQPSKPTPKVVSYHDDSDVDMLE